MMNTPGDRSGGFGDRPDTGSPASSLGSSGRSYSGADLGPGSGDDSPRYQQSPVSFGSDGNYQQFASTRDVTKQPLFSRVFGEKYLTYPGGNTQAVAARQFGRYLDPSPVRTGFGKLFGGAEGEMTIAGPRTAGIRPQTFTEGVGGLLASLAVPGGGMLERAGRTVYAPEGYLPEGYEQPEGGLLEQILGGFSGLFQPEPETVGRAVGQVRDTAASLVDQARQGITSVLRDPVADDMVASVSAPRSELSQTVSGGRFEDESARPQVMTPGQEVLTIEKQTAEPEVFTPNVTTITSGAPPFARMELGPAARGNVLLNQLGMRKGIR